MTWLDEFWKNHGYTGNVNLNNFSDRALQILQLDLLDQIHERLIEIRNLLHDPAEDQP